MNLITKLSYERGTLPDRYWYQLNDKSAHANYNEQILMLQDDEEEIVTRSSRSRSQAVASPSHKKSPLPECRPKPQARDLTTTTKGVDTNIIQCPLPTVKQKRSNNHEGTDKLQPRCGLSQ